MAVSIFSRGGKTIFGMMTVLSLFMGGESSASRNRQPQGTAGDFDYYLMALSWSPSYCEEMGSQRGDPQCSPSSGRLRPYEFVLHGLWPQYETARSEGKWPQFCENTFPRQVPDNITTQMLSVMPSPRLVQWEWQKHGTCSGFDMAGYFNLAKSAFEKIKIPERFQTITQYEMMDPAEIKKSFIEKNQSLSLNESMIYVTCSRRKPQLREVWICLDKKTLQPRTCGQLSVSSCPEKVRVLPARP